MVSREHLIDVLWGEDPPPRAARSLETKVSRLRASLGDSATVVARGGGYVLNAPADEIDVCRFEGAVDEARSLLSEDPGAAAARLDAALALWRGEALGGLREGALAIERARLEEARLEALELSIDADLARGEAASLVGELQALRSEHPTRERFAEQLMLALYRSGRQAEALEAYRCVYRELRDDLGLKPSPRLRELEQAILLHDNSLGPLPLRARLLGTARRRRLVVAAAVTALIVLAIALIASPSGTHRRRTALRPGVILVDAASGTVRADVPVGGSEGGTRFGYGHFWTLGENGVMAEIDPGAGTLVRLLPVGVEWGGITVGAGGIWIADRNSSTLLRIDPLTGRIGLRVRLSTAGLRHAEPNMGIALDGGSL